jgi:predicted nucleotidyltransferase
MTTKSIQANSLLRALFTSQARVAILKLLFLNAGNRYYLREIATLSRQPVQAVQRELERLERAGLIQSVVEGNRKYFHANRQSPVFTELRTLLVKTAGLGALLEEHVRRVPGEIFLAFLFGSYARGEDTSDSDIDLLVIGKVSARQLTQALRPAREQVAREINPVVITESEFSSRFARGDHFLNTVLREPKIFLVGGQDDLDRLAGAGALAAAPDEPQGS